LENFRLNCNNPQRAMNPILGIDFGAARIGIAISDELQLLAHPVETISGGKNAVARITEIVREKKIEKVVTGVPRNMDGSFGAAANNALRFVEKLRAVVAVVTWDERLTTVAAHRELREAGRKTRETRGYVDQVAAQMILQGYLDWQRQAPTVEEMPR
jgi:putative Holliday junction resolvase